ncbi:MAG: response regulator [Campylobacterota bacterium]|nr:response regulator [Campylobacterota bacterium]
MKILILENEIYLAQSISAKLTELGHQCDNFSSIKDAFKGSAYDVVLLSTNINGQDFYPIIEAYKNVVIILMVSYISNDTVSKPLSAGAKDYIQKPFMIEDLIRKIEHFQNYERLKYLNTTYKKYIDHSFQSTTVSEELISSSLPLFLTCNTQKECDAFAFKYAENEEKPLHFISLTSTKAFHEITTLSESAIIYISDFQALKKSDHPSFFNLISNRKVIVSSTEKIVDIDFKVLEMKSHNQLFEYGDILPIEDYVKYIVLNYQHKFPDTELSKRLGISRKSLWEKRKKYGIVKKK